MKKITEFIKSSIADFKKVPAWLIALSAVTTVLMNLLANKTLYSDGAYLSIDCGLMVSWVMFLVMDIATQKYGGKASFAITMFDVAVALAMSGIMAGVAAIPESAVSGWFQTEEAAVSLNGLVGNSYLVILTSLFAYVCSSGVDILSNVTIGKLFNKTKTFEGQTNKRTFKGFIIYFFRAYGSTFLSQLTDNLVFQFIAYPLLFNIPCTPLSIFLGALLAALVELVAEFAFAPVGYFAITKKEKEA